MLAATIKKIDNIQLGDDAHDECAPLGMLAATLWKEDVTHSPTTVLMMNTINFC
jgi:hypothetical protein